MDFPRVSPQKEGIAIVFRHVEHGQDQSAPSPPPNGGFKAWLQVVGAFCIFLNTWGIMNSFGAFQAYYQSNLLSDHTPSQISWIGSMQAALLFIVSALSGPLFDMGYMRSLVFVGSTLTVLGMMLTSICHVYWQFFLCQGVLVGLGNGLLFLCAVTNIGQYFTTRKALATGLAGTGANIGGIVFPVLFNRLTQKIGFGWATRVIAFIVLAVSITPVLGFRQRVQPAARRKLFRTEDFRDIPYQCINGGAFFGFMGIYVVFFYAQVFADTATNMDITAPDLATYLIALLNAGGFFGRLLPNLIADRIGYLNMQTPAVSLTAVMAFCWIGIHNAAGTVAFVVLFAFFAGSFCTFGPTVVSLSPDLQVLGTRMGVNLLVAGFGVLIGPPIAGALLNAQGGSWLGVQIWCGTTIAVASGFMLAARLYKTGLHWIAKA